MTFPRLHLSGSVLSSLRRVRRLFTHTSIAFLIFRYRYLVAFVAFGFLSILVEVFIVQRLLPESWPLSRRATLAFVAGLLVSYTLNASFNFRVPHRYLIGTFARFALVSLLSFALNMAILHYCQHWLAWSYGLLRFLCSGVLCLLAYHLHRRLTFRATKNFGVAIYASENERVYRIFRKVGRACDHIHIDLVDETMRANPSPICLDQIQRARRLWPGVPFALHVMSRFPSRWLEKTGQHIDWYLFHLSSNEDLFPLLAWCQQRGKKVGIVWHVDDPVERLYALLPHVDFVMVLGIAVPGQSGQSISEPALAVAKMLEEIRGRYNYEVMFDGSVNQNTIERIHGKYVVAASAVLNSEAPVQAIYRLKTGPSHEQRAA